MKYKFITKPIVIKIPIHVNDELREFIFKNSNYRRKVWNDFVEEYRRCKECDEKFNPTQYSTKYYNEVEKLSGTYTEYCIGIREQVSKDMKTALELCMQNHGDLHFKKFDRFRCAFKVHTKPTDVKLSSGITRFNSRVYIVDNNLLQFRVSEKKTLYIQLKEFLFQDTILDEKEPIFCNKKLHCDFRERDIKEITFLHELGKFYVNLTVEVMYFNIKDKSRKKKAGIDLGIHNPVMLYDGERCLCFRLSKKEITRLYYLERRRRRLQSILDRKTYQSMNYYKVLKKYRIAGKKMYNIRLNWRRKLAKKIATTYRKICVDNYSIPTEQDHEITNRYSIRKINAYNRLHGMYYFYQSLIHTCDKYGCKYIEAPTHTTCKCSNCSGINKHLPLSQRIFICEYCGYTIDRDINAAQNCYSYL